MAGGGAGLGRRRHAVGYALGGVMESSPGVLGVGTLVIRRAGVLGQREATSPLVRGGGVLRLGHVQLRMMVACGSSAAGGGKSMVRL